MKFNPTMPPSWRSYWMPMALAINRDELEQKAEGYALRILEFNGQADLIDLEIERLSKMKAGYSKTAEKLKETIKSAMMQFGVDKIKTTKVSLSFRKSEIVEVPEEFAESIMRFMDVKVTLDPEKVRSAVALAREEQREVFIPSNDLLKYIKIKTEISKTLIKTDLKAGTTVGDCMIIENKSLQIK